MEHSIEFFFVSEKENFKVHQSSFKGKGKKERFCELGIIDEKFSDADLIPLLNPSEIKASPNKSSISAHFLAGSNYETTRDILERYINKFEIEKYYIKVYSDDGDKVFEKNTYNPVIDPVFGEILYFTPGHYGKGRGWLLRFHNKTSRGFNAELLDYKGYGVPDEAAIKKIVSNSPWKYQSFNKYYVGVEHAKMYAYLFKQSGIILPESIDDCVKRQYFESMNELTHDRVLFTEEAQEELDNSIRKIERLSKSIDKLESKSSLDEEEVVKLSKYKEEKERTERYRDYLNSGSV